MHDYSEGYSCRQQDEVQSEYFDVTKVSLRVTILYRHAQENFYRAQSTEDEPQILKEHIFVISDDGIQDHDSVNKVQNIIDNYLQNNVCYPVATMHNVRTDAPPNTNLDTVLETSPVLSLILVT